MPRAKRRGGRRPGAGRPVSTESKSTPPISYRVSAEQRRELEQEAKRLALSGPNEAAKRRAFPPAE